MAKGIKQGSSHYIYCTVNSSKISIQVLPSLHSLTGCDVSSKIGTKKLMFLEKPEEYPAAFGKESYLTETEIKRAGGISSTCPEE